MAPEESGHHCASYDESRLLKLCIPCGLPLLPTQRNFGVSRILFIAAFYRMKLRRTPEEGQSVGGWGWACAETRGVIPHAGSTLQSHPEDQLGMVEVELCFCLCECARCTLSLPKARCLRSGIMRQFSWKA